MPSTKAKMNLSRKTKYKGEELNVNQRRFCREYVANGMMGVAAWIAVYKSKSRNGVRVNVCKALRDPKIRAYIETLYHEQDDYELRRAQLIEKDRRLNDFNPLEEMCSFEDGQLVVTAENIERVSALIGDCVTEVETEVLELKDGGTKTTFRIKLMDKNRAHERERKMYGLENADSPINVNVGVGIGMDWDKLANPPEDGDIVEGKIEALEHNKGDGK